MNSYNNFLETLNYSRIKIYCKLLEASKSLLVTPLQPFEILLEISENLWESLETSSKLFLDIYAILFLGIQGNLWEILDKTCKLI